MKPDTDLPLTDYDQLLSPFRDVEKPREDWRIGPEAEKFGVHASTGEALAYDGPHGVLRVLEALAREHDWAREREVADGPIISLKRGFSSITLEPGAQLELSGAPADTVHEICGAARGHMAELRNISDEMSLVWLGVGFHPLATQESLPWVPKLRYAIMREYLPTRGGRALDMMRRTATVQANLDFSDEEDATRKLRVGLVLAPLINAMTANSPFFEGRISGKKSLRGEVWLDMDPDRSGLLPELCRRERLGYRDYADWALDVPMFLVKREGRVIPNTRQTFREFWQHGCEGHRATVADWKLHLNTLFPEARLKNTLEFRACDSLPTDLACSVPALFAGLMYDETALAEAEQLAHGLDLDAISRARPALVTHALAADIEGLPVRALAERILEIAVGGLRRRSRLDGRGQDETIHLAELGKLVERGLCPADRLLEGLDPDDRDLRSEILARTRI